MLRALWRWLWPREAPQTATGPSLNYVTREELDLVIAKFEQRQEFELGEWFDKFSALHARTEKRVNRDRARQNNNSAPTDEPLDRPSVLALRRPWSA